MHTRFACLALSPIPKTPEAQDSTRANKRLAFHVGFQRQELLADTVLVLPGVGCWAATTDCAYSCVLLRVQLV